MSGTHLKQQNKIYETMVFKTLDIRQQRTVITERQEVNAAGPGNAAASWLEKFTSPTTGKGTQGGDQSLLQLRMEVRGLTDQGGQNLQEKTIRKERTSQKIWYLQKVSLDYSARVLISTLVWKKLVEAGNSSQTPKRDISIPPTKSIQCWTEFSEGCCLSSGEYLTLD